MNNYEADRAMNQKRLRMEGEGAHSVVQGNGLPLNYIDNGHQLGYPAYGGAYNAHYPPPEAFSAYGPPPPGGYGPPQYAPPAHQNYHQPFAAQQQGQPPQLHMPPQSHMSPSGPQATYAGTHDHHKSSWPMAPLDAGKLPDVKHAPVKQEVKMEPTDMHRPVVSEAASNLAELEQPKIKIKTDLFKPDQEGGPALRPEPDKTPQLKEKGHVVVSEPMVITSVIPPRTEAPRTVLEEPTKPADVTVRADDKAVPTTTEQPTAELRSAEALVEAAAEGAARVSDSGNSTDNSANKNEKFPGEDESKIPNEIYFGTPDVSTYRPKTSQSPAAAKSVTPSSALEPKKRGRPKGSTNKPKAPPPPAPALAGARAAAPAPRAAPVGRPRAPAAYQYAVRPFRRDFSGIQFRRRWSDDCLDSSHIPNEVYFGDVPVPTEVLFNYYDAGAERERAAQAQLAAQKAQQAKMAALASARVVTSEITTVDSSSSDDSSDGSSSDSDDSDADDSRPLKRGPGRPRGSKTSPRVSTDTPARRGRPPVPPELREPGITDMKRFCKAAGIRFDYKKLVDGCTKNKERVAKMMELLVAKGLQGKPTLEKCQALKEDTNKKKAEAKQKKEKERKSKVEELQKGMSRRVTRGQTSSKPRQKIVISSDEDDDTLDTRRTLSKLRSMVNDTDSD